MDAPRPEPRDGDAHCPREHAQSALQPIFSLPGLRAGQGIYHHSFCSSAGYTPSVSQRRRSRLVDKYNKYSGIFSPPSGVSATPPLFRGQLNNHIWIGRTSPRATRICRHPAVSCSAAACALRRRLQRRLSKPQATVGARRAPAAVPASSPATKFSPARRRHRCLSPPIQAVNLLSLYCVYDPSTAGGATPASSKSLSLAPCMSCTV